MSTKYRLTATDEAAITDRLIDVVGSWTWHQRPRSAITQGDRIALRRIAAHSIGCSLDDLRDSEIDWIDGRIERVITEGH